MYATLFLTLRLRNLGRSRPPQGADEGACKAILSFLTLSNLFFFDFFGGSFKCQCFEKKDTTLVGHFFGLPEVRPQVAIPVKRRTAQQKTFFKTLKASIARQGVRKLHHVDDETYVIRGGDLDASLRQLGVDVLGPAKRVLGISGGLAWERPGPSRA